MNTVKKIISVLMSAVLILGICSAYSFAAAPKITGLKIISLPKKTTFIQGDDWIYGIWEQSETERGKATLVTSPKISMTHNPGGGIYPDRGMLDMSGLVIEVSYSDGTLKEIEYCETLSKSGFYAANILVSPKRGYSLGTNIMEVYLQQDTSYYDSYEIEIIGSQPFEPSEDSTAIIDKNNYITGLKTAMTKSELESYFSNNSNAEIIYSKSIRNSKYYGTDSTLTLKYEDGQTKTYTVVIYGDIDGNGITNSDDIAGIVDFIAGGSMTEAQLLAANVDGMRRITENDIAVLADAISGNEINQIDPSV